MLNESQIVGMLLSLGTGVVLYLGLGNAVNYKGVRFSLAFAFVMGLWAIILAMTK